MEAQKNIWQKFSQMINCLWKSRNLITARNVRSSSYASQWPNKQPKFSKSCPRSGQIIFKCTIDCNYVLKCLPHFWPNLNNFQFLFIFTIQWQITASIKLFMKHYSWPWAVVVAQLLKRSLPIPEVHGSNPAIGKIYWTFVYCQLYWKDENKEKRGREWPIFKTLILAFEHRAAGDKRSKPQINPPSYGRPLWS